MLESVTIFNKGGLILYQYRANPSVMGAGEGAANSAAFTEQHLNTWMQKEMLGRKQTDQTSAKEALQQQQQQQQQQVAVLVESVQARDTVAVALYPDVFFDGPRAYLKGWIRSLLDRVLEEYTLYEMAVTAQNNNKSKDSSTPPARPDPAPFDKTFQALLEQTKSKQDKTKLQQQIQDTATDTKSTANKQQQQQGTNISKKGKEKRHWHDGKAKVTKEAMAQLDFSKADSNTGNASSADPMDPSEQAIAEARAAYLPNYGDDNNGTTDEDDMNMEPDLSQDNESSWGASLQSVLDQMAGNKVLTEADLKAPLEEMQKLLTSKNVAQEVAQEICNSVQQSLQGKRLNSFYRVKTAVRQGLEAAITKILHRGRKSHQQLDIIRAAMDKKNSGNSMFNLGGSSNKNQRPYVAVVLGINGVGKSTSLAKLAYYFQSHKLYPILVAGDTFRSGAVEQLNVHAKCLELPLFHQGYAKDPSAVAKAAIVHAMAEPEEEGQRKPDVVLIDTAGRMQNNTPLMNALGKLVKENKPDLILLVAEALVGNDGVDQLQMFNKAMQTAKRQVDAIILTKFDTVSDKVGAALTMTHVTGAPILFVGTGQKYHHLKPLQASTVIQSLFS